MRSSASLCNAFGALGIVVTTALEARAEDLGDLDALLTETVGSTASKIAETSSDAPALSTNISAEDLRRFGIRTLAEAYNFLSLGMVTEDPLAEVDIGARGAIFAGDEGRHVLLLIDGHATNDQLNGGSLHLQSAGIPLELIDHIEVVLGPGSVLYGSNAMLGVINVVTKKAKDNKGIHVAAEGSVSPSINRQHEPIEPSFSSRYLRELGKEGRIGIGGGTEFDLLGKPAEISGQIEYDDFKGPAISWGPQDHPYAYSGPHSPVGQWVGKTRNSYYADSPYGYVHLAWGALEANIRLARSKRADPFQYQNTNTSDLDEARTFIDNRHASVDVKVSHSISQLVSVVARAYADSSDRYRQYYGHFITGCSQEQNQIAVKDPTAAGCVRAFTENSRWGGAELQANFDWLKDGTLTTLVGTDLRVRQGTIDVAALDLETFDRVDSVANLRRTDKTGAAYGQMLYRPSSSIIINAGARLDADDAFGARVSPRVAVVGELWKHGTAKATYSEAFRAPTATERYFTDHTQVLASPDLQPETVRSAEFSLQQKLGTHKLLAGVFGSRWNAMVYPTRYADLQGKNDEGAQIIRDAKDSGILRTDVVSVTQYKNLATVNNYGVNVAFEGDALDHHFVYGANVTLAYARRQVNDQSLQLPLASGIFGNARVGYDFQGSLPFVGIAARFTGSRTTSSSAAVDTAAHAQAGPLADVRATVSGDIPWIKPCAYRLALDYNFQSDAPYLAGPNQLQHAELAPTVRLTAMAGLQYNFSL